MILFVAVAFVRDDLLGMRKGRERGCCNLKTIALLYLICYNIVMNDIKTSKRQIAAPFIGIFVMLAILGLLNAQVIAAYAHIWTQPEVTATVQATKAVAHDSEQRSRPAESDEPIVMMPSAGITAPVVYGMDSIAEVDVQKALEQGVLHFGGSALPGERGNAVFIGHSSGQPWAPGDYKFVFTMLQRLQAGDTVELAHEGELYQYEVTETMIVEPTDVSVLDETNDATATFITCWPVGLNAQRMVVKTKLVSHQPRDASTDERRGAPELQGALPGDGYSAAEAVGERLR